MSSRTRYVLAALCAAAVGVALLVAVHVRRQNRKADALAYLNQVSNLGDGYQLSRIVDDADQNMLNPWWVLYSGRLSNETVWEGKVSYDPESRPFMFLHWPCDMSRLPASELLDGSDPVLPGRLIGATVARSVLVAKSIKDSRAWVCVVYGRG